LSTPPIYTLSLHDALPISHTIGGALDIRPNGNSGTVVTCELPYANGSRRRPAAVPRQVALAEPGRAVESCNRSAAVSSDKALHRSEEHTSELQSRFDLVCR